MTDVEPRITFQVARSRLRALVDRLDRPRFRVAFQCALAVLLLSMVALIFLLGAQLRYEGMASEAFEARDYQLAGERYLKALRVATLTGRDRYLYLIGLCYYNQKEYDRAMDFYMHLSRDHPGSPWKEAGASHMLRIVQMMAPDAEKPGEGLRLISPMGRAFARMRSSRRVLVEAIQGVQGGDIRSADLERLYEGFKRDWEAFNAKRREAFQDPARSTPRAENEQEETAP